MQDNIWIERFWRTIKQNTSTDTLRMWWMDLRAWIGRYMEFYKRTRPSESRKRNLPSKIYRIKDIGGMIFYNFAKNSSPRVGYPNSLGNKKKINQTQ